MNTQDVINIRNCCSAKENVKRIRRQPQTERKNIERDTSDKGLSFQMYKQLLKLNIRKFKKNIKNGPKTLTKKRYTDNK